MKDTLTTAVTGVTGVVTSGVVEHVNPDQLGEGMGLLTQIVILVATLIGLFKKKQKPKIEEKSRYLENE